MLFEFLFLTFIHFDHGLRATDQSELHVCDNLLKLFLLLGLGLHLLLRFLELIFEGLLVSGIIKLRFLLGLGWSFGRSSFRLLLGWRRLTIVQDLYFVTLGLKLFQ